MWDKFLREDFLGQVMNQSCNQKVRDNLDGFVDVVHPQCEREKDSKRFVKRGSPVIFPGQVGDICPVPIAMRDPYPEYA